jgi:hypothetical protein
MRPWRGDDSVECKRAGHPSTAMVYIPGADSGPSFTHLGMGTCSNQICIPTLTFGSVYMKICKNSCRTHCCLLFSGWQVKLKSKGFVSSRQFTTVDMLVDGLSTILDFGSTAGFER